MSFTKKTVARAAAAAVSVAVVSIGLMACAPSSGGQKPAKTEEAAVKLGISDKGYTLDKLVEAAKKEGPLVVSDSTGKITDMADAFTAKYGIKVTGVKQKTGEATEIAIREAQAKNIQTDVYLLALAVAQGGRLVTFDRGISPDAVAGAQPKHLVTLAA